MARTRHTNKENGSEPDFVVVPSYVEAVKEELENRRIGRSINCATPRRKPPQDVASALSQVRTTAPASGMCQVASSVLCLNESEVSAGQTHGRKTRRLGICVDPSVEYCTLAYASVTKAVQITDNNKRPVLSLLFIGKFIVCFGDVGPGR